MLYKLKMHLKQLPVIHQIVSYKNKRKFNLEEQKKMQFLKESGVTLANQLFDIFESNHIDAFLNFGSLLGVIRDGKFMDHDDDIDFGIIVDHDFDWKYIEATLNKYEIYKFREFHYKDLITEQSYRFGNLTFDIFACYPNSNFLESYFYYRDDTKIYHSKYEYSVALLHLYHFKKTNVLDVKDIKCKVPQDAEDYLASIYSSNWKIPDPKWNHRTGPAFEDLNDVGTIVLKNK